jgi:hypothetical protein
VEHILCTPCTRASASPTKASSVTLEAEAYYTTVHKHQKHAIVVSGWVVPLNVANTIWMLLQQNVHANAPSICHINIPCDTSYALRGMVRSLLSSIAAACMYQLAAQQNTHLNIQLHFSPRYLCLCTDVMVAPCRTKACIACKRNEANHRCNWLCFKDLKKHAR